MLSQTEPAVTIPDSSVTPPPAKRRSLFNKSKKDTTQKVTKVEETVFKDSARLAIERMPREALRRSAVIPGWGQIKNKRWWKVPIIYGGFVGLGLAVEFNQRYYKQILEELQFRYDNPDKKRDPELEEADERRLIDVKDFYRRNRDLSVLAGVGLYAINIIDAYVDAKFFRYDISDELSFQVRPSLISAPVHASAAPVPALKIQLKL